MRVSASTVGRCVPVLALILAVAAGGCAARHDGRGSPSARGPSRVTVETSGAQVVHGSAQAGVVDGNGEPPSILSDDADAAPGAGGVFAREDRDPATPDLASRPVVRPPRLPPPKVIPDGEKATLIYPCRHAETETLRAAVEVLLSPEGAVHASPALNALVVSDKAALIKSLLSVLEELDAPASQLLVEARVVEVSATRDLEYEIRHQFTVDPSRGTFLRNSDVALGVPGAATANQGLDVGVRVFNENGKQARVVHAPA